MRDRVFDSEDDAAQFIAIVKANDPNDDFIYVISGDPRNVGKYIIEIFGQDGRPLGRV
ncbi:hypothetical protein MPC4_20200 [Methylocella tundrae]|uniref:Uncharacterized protein n=1 Tax=Methylocella tundrae TaxID=227605 RepID=A0A8B6M6P8_METTU|nr:hypothetical protein MPC1_7840003 [Methylocella tundrae]VTZ49990.1 hypothetical protein MPC4_20200 [Methylocella tundrae]